MKKNPKIIIRVLSFVMCASLLSSSFVFADDNLKNAKKDETVYVMQNADGSIKKQIVSSWIHSDKGIKSLSEKLDLNDIKNVKGDKQPKIENGMITWDINDNDVYYQGTTAKTPPITMTIKYKLDGKDINSDKLAGQSGRLEMDIKYTNNLKKETTINGKSKEIFTPLLVTTVCNLNADNFKNVKCENSKVITDSNNQVVTIITLPGLKQSLGSSYDIIKEVADVDLHDEYKITCDVKDFELSPIITAVTNDIPLDGVKESKDINQLTDSINMIKDVQEATLKLADGSSKISDAMKTFSDKMTELETNYKVFSNGIGDLKKGSSELHDGSSKLADGTKLFSEKMNELDKSYKDFSNGVNDLKKGSSTLNDGAKGLADGVYQYTKAINDMFDTLNKKLPEIDKKIGEAKAATGGSLETIGKDMKMTEAQMGEISKSIKNISTQLPAIQSALDKIKASSMDDATKKEISEPLEKSLNLLNQEMILLQKELGNHAATLTEMGTEMQKVQAAVGNFNSDYAKIKTQLNGIQSQLKDKSSQLNDGAKKVSGGADALNSGIGKLKDGSAKVSDGIAQLAKKSLELNDGAKKVSGGVDALNSGAGKLKDGSDKVNSGIGQLNDGSHKISDKTKELSNGMNTFNEKAHNGLNEDKLKNKVDEVKDLIEIKDKLVESTEDYTSFTGKPEDCESSVKFVMKTDKIEKTKVDKTVKTENKPSEEKVGFFKKISNFFKDLFHKD